MGKELLLNIGQSVCEGIPLLVGSALAQFGMLDLKALVITGISRTQRVEQNWGDYGYGVSVTETVFWARVPSQIGMSSYTLVQ